METHQEALDNLLEGWVSKELHGIEEMEKAIHSICQILGGIMATVADLKAAVDAQTAAVAGAVSAIKSYSADMAELEATITAINANTSALNTAVAAVTPPAPAP
jgi:hypothetical protein